MQAGDALRVVFMCGTSNTVSVMYAYGDAADGDDASVVMRDALEDRPVRCDEVQAMRIARGSGLTQAEITFHNFDDAAAV